MISGGSDGSLAWYLEGCRIHGSAGRGLDVSPAVIRASAIYTNTSDGLRTTNGELGGSAPDGCDLFDNGGYNIAYLGTGPLIATYNWWGTIDVATIQSKLNGNITYEPFAGQHNVRTMRILINSPLPDFAVPSASHVSIQVALNNDLGQSLAQNTVQYCKATFSTGETPVQLFDDGAHNDGAANDGIYGAIWVPATGGAITITVAASDRNLGTETAQVSGSFDPGISSAPLVQAIQNLNSALSDYLDYNTTLAFDANSQAYMQMSYPTNKNSSDYWKELLSSFKKGSTTEAQEKVLETLLGKHFGAGAPGSGLTLLAEDVLFQLQAVSQNQSLTELCNATTFGPSQQTYFKNNVAIDGNSLTVSQAIASLSIPPIPDQLPTSFPMDQLVDRVNTVASDLRP